MEGAAILAEAGLLFASASDMFRIDVRVGGTWQTNVAQAGGADLSRSGNTLSIDENVDYINTGSEASATQARVNVVGGGIVTGLLFPANTLTGGAVTLETGQILRFTSIECDITDGS